ncbi:MAG: ADP-dependent glucokinase/phosphofructokinase [Anaerocolumna sp.]
MSLEEKYMETYREMEKIVAARIKNKSYAALGYTSNLDILCDFQVSILNKLLKQFMSDADLSRMRAAKKITKMEEFLETIVYFCTRGIGGEVDIADFNMIRDTFMTHSSMGGTAAQGAMALAAVGCPSIVHLTDDSKEVCNILSSPYIHTVSKDEKLVHTDEIIQSAEPEIHYIIQFKKGDRIKLGAQTVTIPVSNRLIITKITVNETVPFSKSYYSYIEKHAKSIKSNVLSSFNAILSQDLLLEKLEYVKAHIEKYKSNNPGGMVYFEDAHYHNREVRQLCLETIYPYADIVSLNEEELEYTLKMYDNPVNIGDILSCVRGARYIKEKFKIKKGVIVHTKDYSMYVGEKLKEDIEKGLMMGNILATAKAVNGRYGTKNKLEEVMELPLSSRGLQYRKVIEKEKLLHKVTLVPSKYIDTPRYTIGLGDSFTAGVQLLFLI